MQFGLNLPASMLDYEVSVMSVASMLRLGLAANHVILQSVDHLPAGERHGFTV